MATVLQAMLRGSLAVLGYTWVAYPLLLAVCARVFCRRPASGQRPETRDLPHIHMILSCYNEAEVIEARLRNFEELEYPPEKLTIHIATDGCTDGTAEIIRGKAETGEVKAEMGCGQADGHGASSSSSTFSFQLSAFSLHLYEFPENRGKPAVLKDLVSSAERSIHEADGVTCHSPLATRHLLVFTDANTIYAADALRRLAEPFADPEIGGVVGRVVLYGKAETGKLKAEVGRGEVNDRGTSTSSSAFSLQPSAFPPEGSYWGFETKLKMWESALDSCLGANGPIYAIRPELFWEELPPNTVVDDLVIAMKVREFGKRVIFEPSALSWEELPETKNEWGRRVRIGSGDYQAISFCRRCLLPRYGWFAWAFWSHKVLRWFTPHVMLLSVVSAFTGSVLSLSGFWISGFRFQDVLFHLVSAGALVAALLWGVARALSAFSFQLSALRPLSLLDHFFTMQLALFCGFIRFCRGELKGSWRRTPR